ncbi:DUF1850 domain-containing protein [Bacillus sp. FJAT-22090]|uniref:DUF1850 domain-containing protein n=1 Tax=Bacillus sp. FJAT-22090 TaxID=1581038 RepID=UPI00119D5878|nr:DUF1850 domain-containing protein [Bacillus sp. FJAT-22090]
MQFLKKLLIPVIACGIALLIFYPYQQAFVFMETRTDHPSVHYIPIEDDNQTFQIRYTHSIHKTDVVEFYKVINKSKIQLLKMVYTDLAIGLPGFAEEGQTFEEKDGKYILTYNNEVIDSFTILIGNINLDLVLQYEGREIDLKKALQRGKSYLVEIKKISLYQQMKGENMNG